MADLSTNDVQGRTITAFFDTREAAQKAIADLTAAGVPREHVQLTEGSAAGATARDTRDSRGFWDELKDLFLPDQDRYGYAEGLSRGGFLISVRSDEANYTRVVNILDQDGAIDMDEREETWRKSGWTGYQAGTYSDDRTVGTTAAAATVASATAARPVQADTRPAAAVDTRTTAKDDTVIPVYEETANVAKRDVNHGRVRLRSYVVETPFSQQVNLRQEQVHVERRPVDRPVGATDAVFQDRVIEAEQHGEEAFISKDVRLKEEVGLRKTVENQSHTMSDTLRQTKVDVEDARKTGVATAGLAGSTAGAFDSSRIADHMPVIASDGTQVGTVDHLEGTDKIKLAKTTSPDGQHHYIPLSWVDRVDTRVHLKKNAADVKTSW